MKNLTLTFSTLLVVGVLVGCASGDHLQDIRWNGDLNMTQAAALNSREQKFCRDSLKLRKKIRATSEDLISARLNTSYTDYKKVEALQEELKELSANLVGYIVNFELEARKIAPDTNYVRRAYIRNYNWICERRSWPIRWVSAK